MAVPLRPGLLPSQEHMLYARRKQPLFNPSSSRAKRAKAAKGQQIQRRDNQPGIAAELRRL